MRGSTPRSSAGTCPNTTSPGELIVPQADDAILADINAHPEVWGDEGTSYSHSDCPNGPFYDALAQQNDPYNVKPLFYLMSYVNQTADFLPSDSFEGDDLDYLGWVDFTKLDQSLRTLDLSDNDAGCDLDDGRDHSTCKGDQCNADGDLQAVYTAGYTTAMRAVPSVIDTWRRTIDSRAPSSTVEFTRTDGLPMREWNNSPITVHMTDADDDEDGGFRASGLWKIHGELDGARIDGARRHPLVGRHGRRRAHARVHVGGQVRQRREPRHRLRHRPYAARGDIPGAAAELPHERRPDGDVGGHRCPFRSRIRGRLPRQPGDRQER